MDDSLSTSAVSKYIDNTVSNPVVSIIVVVYNAVNTLEETIKSVLAQTFANKELLIIDGGSKDGTLQTLHSLKAAGVSWISEPDNGIYDAMNKGIRMAKGEWIYFLGADDVFYDNQVLQNVFSNPIIGNSDFIYGNVYAEGLKRIYDGEFSRERLLFQNMSHQAIFFRKEIFDIVGFYDTTYRTFADWKLNIECFFNPEIRIHYMEIVVANFAAGGLGTSHPDIPFLRQFLFPKNLAELKLRGVDSLKNIQIYDKWWRLIRSLRLKEIDSAKQYLQELNTPLIIQQMYRHQSKLPEKRLWMGIISKTTMLYSYSLYRLSIFLKA